MELALTAAEVRTLSLEAGDESNDPIGFQSNYGFVRYKGI